jgi:hypothetical protein
LFSRKRYQPVRFGERLSDLVSINTTFLHCPTSIGPCNSAAIIP